MLTGWRWWLPGLAFLALGAAALLAGRHAGQSGTAVALTAADAALLPERPAIALAVGRQRLEGSEQRTRTDYAGGSSVLEYRFQGSGDDSHLFVRIAVQREASALAARLAMAGLWDRTLEELQASEAGFALVPRDDLFNWGEASRFGHLQLHGRARGVVLIARAGADVFHLLGIGFGFDDHFKLVMLVAPLLEALPGAPAANDATESP